MKDAAPQTKWVAASADDRIAILTTNAKFETHVRHAFRHETYTLIAVSDFQSHQLELVDTCLGIDYVTDYDTRSPNLMQIRTNPNWHDYTLIGVHSKSWDEARKRDHSVFGVNRPFYDASIMETSSSEIVWMAKRVIYGSRNLDEDPRKYRIY